MVSAFGYLGKKIVAQIKRRMPENYEVELSVKSVFDINLNVEQLIESFKIYGVFPKHRICDDLYHQEIIF